jgi:tetratricopeptide (TPR) repeat protein
LDECLAEAHATLALALVSAGRFTEAERAARKAISLEPSHWGHYFRLGHALWGEDRLRALTQTMELYPDFAFAYFEAAMVHIARSAFDRAESVLRQGTLLQDRHASLRQRFPANGLHWLLGMVRLAEGDSEEARAEFNKEISVTPAQLYAREFAMNAYDGLGFIALQQGRPAEAVEMFERALLLYSDHAKSLVGLGAARAASGHQLEAEQAFNRARAAIQELHAGGRSPEATLVEAFQHTILGRYADALDALRRHVDGRETRYNGWTIPMEPLLFPLRECVAFRAILTRVADNAL